MGRRVGKIDLQQLFSGDWFRPKHKGFLHACCDCGEVSICEFRIVKLGNHRLAVEMRQWRHNGKTLELRKNPEMMRKIAYLASDVLSDLVDNLHPTIE